MSKNTYFFVIFCHFLGLFWQLVTTPHNQIVRKSAFVSVWCTGSYEQKFLKKNIRNGPSPRIAAAGYWGLPSVAVIRWEPVSQSHIGDGIRDWQNGSWSPIYAKIKFVTIWYSGTYRIVFWCFLLQFSEFNPKT